MRKKLSAALSVSLAGATLAGLLTGCSGSGGAESVRLMVWSPSEDQSKDSGEWLQTCCEKFAEMHPEWDITFVYGVADEAAPPVPSARTPRPAPTCSCSPTTP